MSEMDISLCPRCGTQPEQFNETDAYRCRECCKNSGWMSLKDWNRRPLPAPDRGETPETDAGTKPKFVASGFLFDEGIRSYERAIERGEVCICEMPWQCVMHPERLRALPPPPVQADRAVVGEAMEAFERLCGWIQECGPRSCGACGTPNGNCDGDCMAVAYIARDMQAVRLAIRSPARGEGE